MQTYTHAVVGAAIGGALMHLTPFKDLGLVPLAAIAGAIFPDVPIFCQMMLDIFWYKRSPFSNAKEQKGWMLLKELSHAQIMMAILLVITSTLWGFKDLTGAILGAFLIGAISHVVIDCMTHTGQMFRATDSHFLWPINPLFTKVKAADLFGIAEYRYSFSNVVKLKPFEKVTITVSAILAICLMATA